MKYLKHPIIILQWILILFSALAFAFATVEAASMAVDLSSKGFQTYLQLFAPYSILFGATFVVITSQLAIERLGLMTESNHNSFKASNRTQWIQVVKDFYHEIKEDDPYLCKELSRHLMPIHDYLFDSGYKFSTVDETRAFLNRFFASRILHFEQMNSKYMAIGCYRDDRHSYSWLNFRYMIFAMVSIDNCYNDFLKDLEEMYRQKVLEYSAPLIDPKMFELNIREYYTQRQRLAKNGSEHSM